MNTHTFEITGRKVIIRIHDMICENAQELLNSELFAEFLEIASTGLVERNSYLINIFPGKNVNAESLKKLTKCLMLLAQGDLKDEESKRKREGELKVYADFFKDAHLFNDFIEYLYNFWRSYDRFIICDSMGRNWDKRPYRTFNSTIVHLTDLIRGMYRDIQEAVSGDHPRIYRQVAAGAEMATISVTHAVPYYDKRYDPLNSISMIRYVLLNPPLILEPPINKRKGSFTQVDKNPLDVVSIDPSDWLCYPAKVGELTILIYFHKHFIELGLSLCNLFQVANDDDLMKKPDAIYLFGVPGDSLYCFGDFPTVFYEDAQNDLFVAAVPQKNEFGYFGYLKKMVLTLHNIVMMKKGRLPFHGALIKIVLKGNKSRTVLFVGDTGAGKSETLEAIRDIAHDKIQDLFVIADDMGSLEIDEDGNIIGYGTEIGAFLRLDDLRPGYALGQIDRAIIMSANQTNARIILPVTTYEMVIKGHPIDFILYANNYDEIDEDHPMVGRFESCEKAISVFREGTVMSKGTTETSGIVHTYFANIFGPIQYKQLHEKLAQQYFEAFFKKGIFVGEVRTRLGLKGFEQKGPEEAARHLLNILD